VDRHANRGTELFYDGVTVRAVLRSIPIPGEVATILAGVTQDGGGLIFIGGKVIRIPPWDPWIDVLHAFAAMNSVKEIRTANAQSAMAALRQIIISVVQE
jgi:hypothetical protein